MKVWIVMEHGWEHGEVQAVYSSREAADAHVEAEERRNPQPPGYGPLLNVEEYELQANNPYGNEKNK